MAEKEEKPKKESGGGGSSKFLSIGKYFLLLIILVGQAVVAYTIVDKVYPGMYERSHAEEPGEVGTYQMEQLVVNPAKTNGKRYLMVEISLELKNIEHIPLIEAKNAKIQQQMLVLLSAKTVSELTDVSKRDAMRSELSNIVNDAIGEKTVQNLYFIKYVMQ